MIGPITIIAFGVFRFLIGLAIGSFLNAAAFRYKEKGWLRSLGGRSRCPCCNKTLSWQELIPLLSLFIQRGRCRGCKAKISWQYPLVEFLSGLIAIFIPPIGWLPVYVLLLISIIDYRHYLIPDSLVLILAGWGLLEHFVVPELIEGLLFRLAAGLGVAVFFGMIIVLTRGRGIGFGDLKLGAALGLWLGALGVIYALAAAFILGAVWGIGLLALGKKGLKDAVPFGPFLALGAILARLGVFIL